MKCFDKNSNETFDFCFDINDETFKCYSAIKSHLNLGIHAPRSKFEVKLIYTIKFEEPELDDYLDWLKPNSYMLCDLSSNIKRIGLATMLFKSFIMNFPMDLYSIAEVSNTPSINWHLKNNFKIIKQSDNFVYFKYEI